METSTDTARFTPAESTADGEASNGTSSDGAAGTRRKLSDQQEAEVTRLYAETDTPVSEISKRFGIGESSVYRVAQRHGAALRGRTATSTPKVRASATSATTGRGTRGRAAGSSAGRAAAGSTARTTTSSTGNGRRTTASRGRAGLGNGRRTATGSTRTTATPTPSSTGSRGSHEFQVSFTAVRVFTAIDMNDALRQAEAAGAIDITGIVRND